MFEPDLSLNRKFIRWAREEYDDNEIDIHEYEELLDAYMVDGIPKRIRPNDILRLTGAFVKSDQDTDEINFLGYEYTYDEGWYVREDE